MGTENAPTEFAISRGLGAGIETSRGLMVPRFVENPRLGAAEESPEKAFGLEPKHLTVTASKGDVHDLKISVTETVASPEHSTIMKN